MKYRITILRTVWQDNTYEVEADSRFAAEEKAMELAYNDDFVTGAADYDIEDVEEIVDDN